MRVTHVHKTTSRWHLPGCCTLTSTADFCCLARHPCSQLFYSSSWGIRSHWVCLCCAHVPLHWGICWYCPAWCCIPSFQQLFLGIRRFGAFSVMLKLPIQLSSITVIISYKYTKTIGPSVFNFKKALAYPVATAQPTSAILYQPWGHAVWSLVTQHYSKTNRKLSHLIS